MKVKKSIRISIKYTYTTKAPEASDKSVDVKNSVDFHDSTHHYSDSTSVTKRWWIINTTSAFLPATTMGPPAIRFAAAWLRLRDNDLRERKVCFRCFLIKLKSGPLSFSYFLLDNGK